MSDLHSLILLHGHATARAMVPCAERHLVDAAAAILAIEREEIGISYSGFALTSLPHKKIADDQVWEKVGHRLTLTVTPGRLPGPDGRTVAVGVPYGCYARLIAIYLQTQAIRTGCRRVELGRSMNAFLERLGLTIGGRHMIEYGIRRAESLHAISYSVTSRTTAGQISSRTTSSPKVPST